METPTPSLATAAQSPPERARALIGRRLLALFYDLWPAMAMWFLLSALFAFGHALAAGDARDNIAPFSALQVLLWLCCWLVTGAYAMLSWARGGQTLGMRPWSLRLVGTDGARPGWRALALRYSVGTVSLLLAGLGFWWAWVDRERLTWHDRASGTRLLRTTKPE